MYRGRNSRQFLNRANQVAALAGLFFSQTLAAQLAPTPPTLLKANRLLDPRTGNVLSPARFSLKTAKSSKSARLHRSALLPQPRP